MNITSVDPFVAPLTFLDTKEYESLKVIFFILTFLFFTFFIYFIVVLLTVYFTTPHVQENARYVLFAHMLINDTLYLILGLILSVVYTFLIYIPLPVCYLMITLAATTFKVTPYNLAVMSLERYIAICFPLRHVVFCTTRRSHFVIAVMWFVGLFPHVADFIVLIVSVEKGFFLQGVACRQESLIVIPLQSIIRSFSSIGSLVLVAVVILFTYVRVIIIARKTNSKSSYASKASRTLMLHAIQLLLCLLSLTSSFTESYNGEYVVILMGFNFLLFMCLPRFLSPLIYGIRDEVFNKCIKKIYSSQA
ncbi:odorant receptor 131-2-like [Hyla sarda]|uniref:odorant receptor 131-2-like n=1 Tax=Hyla sarda TaxID=327740 RepID=UPI0024C35586|nr:odorant receptor 131-2-like [Hyla sarda]XP_056416261.1 odorant receptor 131-2-like [Hyla sarda]